jgi:hypothetical protein
LLQAILILILILIFLLVAGNFRLSYKVVFNFITSIMDAVKGELLNNMHDSDENINGDCY